jgi:putative tryptophan/tyrosine transport system substrate-binding protein
MHGQPLANRFMLTRIELFAGLARVLLCLGQAEMPIVDTFVPWISERWLMRRRDLLFVFGSILFGCSVSARAQRSDGMRRVGVLMSLAASDPQGQERESVLRKAMQERGWIEGRNVVIDFRWAAGDPKLLRKYAEELIALMPDVIVAGGGPVIAPLHQATRTVPIVFTLAIDPVSRGYVESLSRPGGNITGFIDIEYGFSTKWLELLKQIAPTVTRVAVLRDPGVIGQAQFKAIEALATNPEIQVQVVPIEIGQPGDLERAIKNFAEEANGGLIVTASAAATLRRTLIISLAQRYRLPAIYPNRFHVISGGLISYGPIFLDQYRRAADYVDRILKGAKPADLPVQAPTKYEVVLNLKTAKELGLKVPRIVVARADEIIE